MSDAKDPFYEDEQGQHILVPEGETIEHVVDDIHAGEAPDGIKSDVLQAALEDKAKYEQSEAAGFPTTTPIFLMGVDENSGVNYSDGLVNMASDSEGHLSAVVTLHNPAAAAKLKEVLAGHALDAISFLTQPENVADQPKLTLEDEITTALNRYSAENDSGTPDFILAEYLMSCLDAYNTAIYQRAEYRGRPLDRFGYEAGTNDLFDVAVDGNIALTAPVIVDDTKEN